MRGASGVGRALLERLRGPCALNCGNVCYGLAICRLIAEQCGNLRENDFLSTKTLSAPGSLPYMGRNLFGGIAVPFSGRDLNIRKIRGKDLC